MDLLQALRANYLTEGLAEDDVNALLGIAEFVDYEPMQDIVRANDVSYDLFVLVEGAAEVTLATGDPVSRLKPGAIIGEFAFFEGGHRSATVMSHTASKAIHLDGEKLLAYMNARPYAGMTIYRNLGRTLCQRLRSANIQIERLVSSL
ncbi:MAG: cyclic nucleotide-binding domain-containing protein [Armatimonadetes bacterium]|nr:cyclic nucleotide-binding domain-containing protein [Armatimonadota bacterium]